MDAIDHCAMTSCGMSEHPSRPFLKLHASIQVGWSGGPQNKLKCVICNGSIPAEQDSITAAHALHVTWIPDAGRRKRKESCLSERLKNRNISYFREKSNSLARQICVLARFPANFSSLGARQTKQRLSRWCGVTLRMSIATRSHRTPHEKFKLLPWILNKSWIFLSINYLARHVPSSRKIYRSNRPQSWFEQGRSMRRWIDRSRPSLLPPVVNCPSSVDRIVLCGDENLSWT